MIRLAGARGFLCAGLLAAAAASLAAAPPPPAGGDQADALQALHKESLGRVVGVTFSLKPMEIETGVEGPKAEGALCGVVAGDGLVLIPGDVFPDPGGDPRVTLAPAEFKVHLPGDRTVAATAVGIDRKLNLAFLKLPAGEPAGLRPVRFRESPPLEIGESVVVVGVLGRKYGFAPALYRATVNASVPGPPGLFGLDVLLQDLSVGGLVLRRDGSAAGLVVKDVIGEDLEEGRAPGNLIAILATMGTSQNRRPGYAMVLPAPAFTRALAAPPAMDLDTDIQRAWLGIVMQALSEDLRDYWKLPVQGGIIVGSVVEGSPAEAAGLQPGDVVAAIDQEPLRIREEGQLPEFRRRIERMGPGTEASLTVYRKGVPSDVRIRLAAAPKTASRAEEYEDEEFGLTVREITIDVQQALNLDRGFEGVYVGDTREGSLADGGGLFPEDVILSINGTAVKTVPEVRAMLQMIRERRDPEAIFFVLRPPDTLFIRVKTDFTQPRDASRGE